MKTKSNHVEGSLEEQPVIGTIDSAGRVEPIKNKAEQMKEFVSWVNGICCKGRHDHWKAELLNELIKERDALNLVAKLAEEFANEDDCAFDCGGILDDEGSCPKCEKQEELDSAIYALKNIQNKK